MNVVTLVDFHDNACGVDRKAGDEFTVSRERFEQINSTAMWKIGKPFVGEVAPEEPESKPRRRQRKAV